MNWKRIPKENSIAPTYGLYSDWKPLLSVEGFHQCVYCTISEGSFGGIRNFHVEHYRPKALDEFKELENDYTNLFYSCSICNSFKSDDWPNHPDNTFNKAYYPDPSKVDYTQLFQVFEDSGLIAGQNYTGTYILNKLYLNRPQLIINRRENLTELKYQELITNIQVQKKKLFSLIELGNKDALDLLKELDKRVVSLEQTYHEKEKTIPYADNQVKRQPLN